MRDEFAKLVPSTRVYHPEVGMWGTITKVIVEPLDEDDEFPLIYRKVRWDNGFETDLNEYHVQWESDE